MNRRAIAAALLLVASGCGPDSISPEVPTKTVPALPFLYEGRSLESWKQVPVDAMTEERVAMAFAIASLEMDPAQSVDLLHSLLRDERAPVRIAGAIAAGRLAPPSAEVAATLVGFLDAPEEALRRHARASLGSFGQAALPALRLALEDERVRVRWAAIVVAGQLGGVGEPLVPLVEKAAREDPEDALRRQALLSLPAQGRKGLRASLAFLESEDTPTRLAVALGIGRTGERAVEPLVMLLAGEGSEVARAEAAGILAELGPAAFAAVPTLLEALGEEGVVRFNAAEALVAIGGPAVSGLEALLANPDEDLAAIAAYALDRIRAR